ncbi:hypothetical protein GCM10023066_42260 [Nocardioides kongjuensis]
MSGLQPEQLHEVTGGARRGTRLPPGSLTMPLTQPAPVGGAQGGRSGTRAGGGLTEPTQGSSLQAGPIFTV